MQSARELALRVRGLRRGFGGLAAVQDLEFDVARGEIFGLVGPDGAGKTSTLRMLAGVMRADAGSIELDGIDVRADPEAAKLHLSYMPQRFGLYEDLSVLENIAFYAALFGLSRSRRDARAGELLAAAGLAGFERRLAGTLSGGMKQKLGLVCALIHEPRVLLLDEPTTGVDPVSRRDFWEILYRLRDGGVAIVMATAYMDEAERCSRLALLHAGRMRLCDTPRGLKQAMPGALFSVSGGPARAIRDALRGAPGVLGVLLMGDRVHVRVLDAAQGPGLIAGALSAHGLARPELAEAEPGIEDVFVALLGEPAAGEPGRAP
ncbi:MAG: ABC transporter ATP-binding protein [Betaproteobacteria bacterium]|nr:ABC transporter ATP-binding protein [Betaproteobacteria bacterium]MBU6511323.1 ABC transporter ATP-binding protein [Betaproteobacteria bacterium]MDE1954494.1 ABC transporter ATP-binding protein [Betaproteobacteria bacterium]MDE2151265.1 ABC transporter ATP-binding protein [Betaproteobacteria bacterium]MDE2479355.1 ABC transporter ATP-binding protein [Betaproteobacteria bacterium]